MKKQKTKNDIKLNERQRAFLLHKIVLPVKKNNWLQVKPMIFFRIN